MTFFDRIIQNSSKRVFSNVRDKGNLKILRILAERGPLNQSELGNITTVGTRISFERWGVKKRLDGTKEVLGLIPNEFVYGVERNKKETHYELTLKGLLAILSEKKLEEVYLIKRYKRFLRQFNNDPKILKLSIEFIKTEIALLLFHNDVKGFEWSKLRVTHRYWNDFKRYDHHVIRNFFVDTTFLNEQQQTEYEILVNEYLINFFMLDGCTTPIPLGEIKDWYQDELEFKESFRKYVDRWYMYLDIPKISKRHLGPPFNRKDIIPYYDEQFWFDTIKYPLSQASVELSKRGISH